MGGCKISEADIIKKSEAVDLWLVNHKSDCSGGGQIDAYIIHIQARSSHD